MLSYRRQYRILGTAAVFALVGLSFFAAYFGARNWDQTYTKGFFIEVGKKGHPRFLTWEYFTEDPAVFVNLGVMVITGCVLIGTLWTSRKALNASTRATEALIATERPYVTGGGGFTIEVDHDYVKNPPGSGYMYQAYPYHKKTFHVDVANYGKTPALLTHFEVQFETQERVKAGHIEPTKRYKHYDWIATGHEHGKTIRSLLIPREKDVIFGCFWYLDFQKDEHYFRFILRVGSKTTHPDIADEVDPEYTKWT